MASRAAYMRQYRAQKRVADLASLPPMPIEQERALGIEELIWWQDRVEALEAEVKHLKAKLAKRPDIYAVANQYSTRPFTPVPKK